VALAEQKDVPAQLRAIGNARPFSTISVKSRVAGQLASIGLKEGYRVKKGELIFTIDPTPFEVALQQAEAILARDKAKLQNAEAEMGRTDELANTKVVSASLVDSNRSAVAELKETIRADEAALRIAKVQLGFCYIRSPIDGRVSLLIVNEGNVVKENDTVLAVINQLQPIYVDFAIPEQHLTSIREHKARGPLAVVAAIPGQTASRSVGKLEVINNQVDSATGTIMLRAQFPNEDELLWPGQFVDVTMTLDVERNMVVVPAEAVQFSQQGRYVALVKPDQTVEFRPVELGESLSQEMVVKKGLKPGDQVVTSGQLRLQPGAKVNPK
jgi:multidrug efflux system membrane fusion protein